MPRNRFRLRARTFRPAREAGGRLTRQELFAAGTDVPASNFLRPTQLVNRCLNGAKVTRGATLFARIPQATLQDPCINRWSARVLPDCSKRVVEGASILRNQRQTISFGKGNQRQASSG